MHVEATLNSIGVRQGALMGSVKEIKDRVQDAIDKGTTAVERVHQDIMHKPIEVLESIAPNLPLTKEVAAVQRKIVGIVYDVIRGVNRTAGELADGVLLAGPRPAKKGA
jgi:hypothetical protein